MKKTLFTLGLSGFLLLSGCFSRQSLPESSPEKSPSFEIQAMGFAYLDFLALLTEAAELYQTACAMQACDRESLGTIFQPLATKYPAGLLFLEDREFNMSKVRQAFSAQEWQFLQTRLEKYQAEVKLLRQAHLDVTFLERPAVQAIINQDPHDHHHHDHDHAPSIKANMHTVQTMVETYAVDWGGIYPDNVFQLETEAKKGEYQYWKALTNPFSNKKGSEHTLIDYAAYRSGAQFKGLVLYQVSEEKTAYQIWGTDETGELVQDKGQPFILTNS